MLRLGVHSWLVRSVAAALLLAYVVVLLGLVPSPRVIAGWFGRATGERFPCESSGCGCASAGACWTQCGCHTDHQRLVWAIEQGVMPPASVRFTDEQWIAAANAVVPGSATCVLCVEGIRDRLRRGIKTARTAPPEAPRAAGASCCATGGADAGCGGTIRGGAGLAEACEGGAGSSCCSEADDSAGRAPWTHFLSGFSCKGLDQLLAFALPVVLPTRVVVIELEEPEAFVPGRPEDVWCASRALEVPEPPPRAV